MTTISLTVVDEDADRLSRLLRTELLSLDVDSVELVTGAVPPGAKSTTGAVTTIIVSLAGSPVLTQLVATLRDWVNRDKNRKIVIRDGDRAIELVGTSPDDNHAAIKAFLDGT